MLLERRALLWRRAERFESDDEHEDELELREHDLEFEREDDEQLLECFAWCLELWPWRVIFLIA